MDSIIMEDEHLDTIPETESDEENESSVKDLNLTPSKFEDLSNIESECDVPVCDDFTTSFNPLFDSYDDSTSSDDESLSDEDVPEENFKIYSNPLFDEEIISTKIDPHHFNAESNLIESLLNRDTSIISSPKFDSLLEEFSGELAYIYLISPKIDEADFDLEEEIRLVEKLLYDNSSPRPLEEFNSENSDAVIKSFSPSPIPVEGSDSLMEEIDIFLTLDDSMPPGMENDDYDSEGDILFLEELLSNDSPSLLENESFHFDVPSSPRPPAKPPDDDGIYFDAEPDTRILTLMSEFSESPMMIYGERIFSYLGYSVFHSISLPAQVLGDRVSSRLGLAQALIMIKPDWSLPFEVMCDASDYAIWAKSRAKIELKKHKMELRAKIEALRLLTEVTQQAHVPA
ncbi:hypothetical protein Tco_0980995 [Tanacetum coccineum]